MRKIFYASLALLVAFELANVWFIMPMPFSQRMRSIDLAYFLYTWRWVFRALLGLTAIATFVATVRATRRANVPMIVTGALGLAVVCFINFRMQADRIFLAPASVTMKPVADNRVESNRLVVGLELDGQARAYPVQFIGYHHQVRDVVAGKPVLVTYCTVCRSGRVYSPVLDGRAENFRLVGMDHFNAMFEDVTTRSWWRQATGEAVTGSLKGRELDEYPSVQTTLARWIALHPATLVMQPDSALARHYSSGTDYETGRSRGTLTGTDTASWHDKSWVVGIDVDGASKAYDWNRLRRERVINDRVGGTPLVIALAADDASFFVFQRPDTATRFTLRNDSLVAGPRAFAFTGTGASGRLTPLYGSQEFWHSWRTFHPETATY